MFPGEDDTTINSIDTTIKNILDKKNATIYSIL